MTTTIDTMICTSCGAATAGAAVCPICRTKAATAPTRPSAADFFELFRLPRRLTVDEADLERRYYALCRELHPDRFHGRSAAERAVSERMTALVNRGYRTLREPVRRALYWLELHGESLGRDNERVPPALAAQVFEVQEKLEALREARRDGEAAAPVAGAVRAIHDELRAQMAALEARLAENFARTDARDGAGPDAETLAETKGVLSELHYLRTLIRDVEKELEGEWSAS